MRHLIGTSAHRRDRRLGADALRPNTCLRRLRLRRANLHQRPDEPTQKPTAMRWVLWFFGHFNAQTPPQNAPFLALLQRNAKAEYANYNNINTLHFCILQFTFVLHPLVFLRSILLLDEV